MKKLSLALVLALFLPLRAQALNTNDILSLVEMPLAVAAVSQLTGVSENDLANILSNLNQADVPPNEFVQVVRYVPVALAQQPTNFVQYVDGQTSQGVTGPALVLPYTHRWTEASGGQQVTRTEVRHAIFLPERLRYRGTLKSEIRRRGIFTVPVYTLALATEGEFAPPKLSELGIAAADVHWSRAHVAVGISDARAIQQQTCFSRGP